jgi:flagellar basal-body rod protein FlgB
MPINLDSYLGVHQDALKVYGQRTEVLAANLANADTPNFRARDIDFRAALAAASAPAGGLSMTNAAAGVQLASTNPSHLNAAGGTTTGTAELKYRVPLAPALDGNTVDVQMEQAAFAENSVRFQATLTFLNARFRGLLTAITGQ